MKKLKDLRRLKDVAELSLNVELSTLSEIKREEKNLRARWDLIEESWKQRAADIGAAKEFDVARAMGVDGAWDKWVAQQKPQIMLELAQISEKREVQLEKTRKAFGQKDALGQLTERIKKRR
ncbi:hypothetical protein [Celeribacter halophilus]|uniref:Flagellar FliJ protein n=1 Tax=Celeribacter halophilus TaxID=576117 RepID=A0A1I3UM27_9RHOB|nr:hypothetical protein [Celeribacter halophilus]PZX10078.1 hypothetical protein LX82_02639 [Celeribacter halophilus]SFJ84508.1 hypothetical protein SAMN04488138_11213 [Celeribacter halophilus]